MTSGGLDGFPGFTIATAAERPGISQKESLDEAWPVFLKYGKVGGEALKQVYAAYPEFQFYVFDEKKTLVAIANSAPLNWDGSTDALPGGFDGLCYKMAEELRGDVERNALAALAISVVPSQRRGGLAEKLLLHLKATAAARHMSTVIIPLRPTRKKNYPLFSMADYSRWRRVDGTPFDPWLRLHEKLGGRILRVDADGMRVEGRLSHWSEWTGLEFPQSGWYVIPEGMAPLKVDTEKDIGIYSEGTVWMLHLPGGR